MKIRNSTWMMFLFVIGMFGFSLFFYSQLPEQMASHWNARGQVDGYMSKTAGLLVMPITSLIMAAVLLGLAQIDPLKRNIEKIRGYYNSAIFILLAFLFIIQLHIISWNLGFQIRVNVLMPVMLGMLFFGLGTLMDKLRPNWIIGVRTPWTLSSPKVWYQTHQWAGLLFKIAACVVLLCVLWSDFAIYFVLAPILSVSVLVMVLSYYFYRCEKREKATRSVV